MTKYFCDLCSSEIQEEYAGVSINKDGCVYHHQRFCLPCFYSKGNWKKICVKPKKIEQSPLIKKLLRDTAKFSAKH